MAGWPKLDPAGQQEVLDRLTAMLLEVLPEDWQRLVIEYRVVGSYSEGRVGLTRQGGVIQDWDPPPELTQDWDPPLEAWHRFQDLRGGMYTEGEGTWFGAQYKLERPHNFKIKYNWDRKPDFAEDPPPEQFALEQSRFPRVESHQPAWYREGLTRATS
jgi:hypothetical protein